MAEKGATQIQTPVNILWEGILLIPIFGIIDSKRAQIIMETILSKIIDTGSRTIILDILGVTTVDTSVANHLIKITKAARLMGCSCIISGISPEIAQTLVNLGVELLQVITTSTLKDAVMLAFKQTGLEVRKTQ